MGTKASVPLREHENSAESHGTESAFAEVEEIADPTPLPTIEAPSPNKSDRRRHQHRSPRKMEAAQETDDAPATTLEVQKDDKPTGPFAHLAELNSFETSFPQLKTVCGEMANVKNPRNDDLLVALDFLKKYTRKSQYGADLAVLWNDALDQHGFINTAKNWFLIFFQPDFVEDASGKKPSRAAKTAFNVLSKLSFLLMNASDSSQRVCSSIVTTGLMVDYLNLLARKDFDPKKMSSKSNKVRSYLVKASQALCYNCLRNQDSNAKRAFTEANGVNIMKPYLHSDYDLIRAKAELTLAFAVSDGELEAMESEEIKYVINDMLKPAIGSETRSKCGFTVTELLHALSALATSNKNKERMVDLSIVEPINQVLKNPADDSELVEAGNLAWILSFLPKGAEALKQNTEFQEVIKRHCDHENRAISEGAQGILWRLEDRPPSTHGRRKARSKKSKADGGDAKNEGNENGELTNSPLGQLSPSINHVMISYDHQHQPLVKTLNNALKERGYITWMDVDRMSGSTLAAMADAVENASAVVVCMSDRYKLSPSCQAEAEYAYRLHKEIIPVRTDVNYQADGWLGLIMGTKLYFDFWEQRQLPACLQGIVKELDGKGKIGTSPPVENGTGDKCKEHEDLGGKHLTNGDKSPEGHLNKNNDTPVGDWKGHDMRKWLRKNKLDHLKNTFDKFDGQLLLELRDMSDHSPTVYYQYLESKLNITSITDVLHLTKALKAL